MYIYESHMGGLYSEDEYLDYESTYCETCGDSDSCLGFVNSKEQAWALLSDKIDRELTEDDEGYDETFNTGGYDKEYVENFINSLSFDE